MLGGELGEAGMEREGEAEKKKGGGSGTEAEEAGNGEATGGGEAWTEGLRMGWRKGEVGTERGEAGVEGWGFCRPFVLR